MENIKKFSKNVVAVLPGFGIALAIAAISKLLESLLPIPLIGASVIALFIGMIINQIKKPGKVITPGLKFTSKKILKLAIILLGASLSIGTILSVGKMSLIVMFFTLLTCFGGGYFIGRALKLNWKLSNLISAGTGICGGSAIAAIAPAIDAEDKDIAYAMSATFLFDMVMIVLFPIMGHWMGLSDMAYGLWAGTAVNDTSSVVAAGFAFSEAAGEFATMVKLTRTLSIIPTVVIFSLINARLKRKAAVTSDSTVVNSKPKINFLTLIPWFILGFLVLAAINSFGIIPVAVSDAAKETSKFLMVAALAAIGMNTDFKEMKESGINPMIHGFIISALVVVVAIAVEYMIGIV
ncbi:MAG: putative sulfate exporter family transporter [Fibrobacter sp.]|nr:putative sulfate exporter family transporter [Fibrobacter sp.]